MSHLLIVPALIKTVATGPNWVSRCDSRTVAIAVLFGFAFNSFISATNKMISSKSSIPKPVWAETGTTGVSPPQSSGVNPFSDNWPFTKSGFAPSLSILFTATITGIPASFAWFIDSIVWGFTHSSAATTNTAISVDFAPLALITVKASWPGVSKNVIFLPCCSTWYAQILWVIPPASPSVTFDDLIKSRSEVFPWSTWPIIEITGDLSSNLEASSSTSKSAIFHSKISSTFTPWELSLCKLISKASATIEAVSKSSLELMFTIIPFFMNSAINFGSAIPIFSENSFKDKISGTVTVSPVLSVKFCWISSTFFSSFFLFASLFPFPKANSSVDLNLPLVFLWPNSFFAFTSCSSFFLTTGVFDFFENVFTGDSTLASLNFDTVGLLVSLLLFSDLFTTGKSAFFTTSIFCTNCFFTPGFSTFVAGFLSAFFTILAGAFCPDWLLSAFFSEAFFTTIFLFGFIFGFAFLLSSAPFASGLMLE